MKKFVPLLFFVLLGNYICGQNGPVKVDSLQSKTDTLRKDALKVFMDASDYVKKEIPYINYVRDIKEADVYIISTYQSTGSGGFEEKFFLVGQHLFAGMRDTVSCAFSPDDTKESRRIVEVKTLKMGLMRYVSRTPLSKFINISFTEPLSETVSTDKWKSWVFRLGLNGYGQGQKTYNEYSLSGNFSASKITKDWKINFNGYYRHSREKFIMDTVNYVSTYDSKNFYTLIVRSINDHWSYGGSATIGSSSYSNQKLNSNIMPGIEYDIFPYSQSTRKQLTFLYKVGPVFMIYNDTTIYDKMKEFLLWHNLSSAIQVIEKWGTINVSLTYSNYLNNWAKNNLSLNSYIELRIAKGLRLYIAGGASLIHDQIGLTKSGATTEEVLLRRKELATQYQYYVSFGFSYTFGSIYNNVVNPRFNEGGGMYMVYY